MSEPNSEKPKRKPRAEGSDRRDSLDDQDKRIGYSEADLDLCIEDATHLNLTESSRWQDLRDHGCDDARILEVLRAILPQTPTYTIPSLTPPARPGFSACGGSVPKLWIGSRQSKDQPPTLSGLAFAARVRTVLDLPRVPVAGGKGQKAKGKRKAH